MVQMKDSGIEWIGAIPESWNIKKIKYLLIQRLENNSPIKTVNILSLTAKQGVIPLSEKSCGGNKPKDDLSAYRLAYPGDIVMNSMNVISGSVGLSNYYGCVSPVYYMLRPTNINNDVRFFNYIFQTNVFQASLRGLGNGILVKESANGTLNTIRLRIPIDKLGNQYLAFPCNKVQHKIADFLDKKCAEIEALSKDIQSEIDTLEEYKKSVITEAVTKGLDPNVEMKDSGIEYIGMHPVTWNITRLKYVLSEKNERSISGDEQLLSLSQYKGVIPSSMLSQRTMQASSLVGYKKVQTGDLVFNKLNPGLARFGASSYEGITSPDFSVYKVNEEICSAEFLAYLLKTNMYVTKFKSIGIGVGDGFSRLYSHQLYCFYVSLPCIHELENIITYLHNKLCNLEKTISEKQKQLETLAEYKKSLIYEYVTGKKEVI